MRRVQRLEGLVIQKRLAGIEQPRYLVMDLVDGSISLYKTPPPTGNSMTSPSGRRSVSSKLVSSLKGSLSRSRSAGPTVSEGREASQLSFEHLTHLSTEKRHFVGGLWEPIFTVPFSVEWKIRYLQKHNCSFVISDFLKS
jgi:hypothetical protein